MPWGLLMKKLIAALALTAALTGSATAADLAARPYAKAPVPMAPVYNWTGFYIFGGGGGGDRELRSGDLVQQRLELLVVMPVDQRDGEVVLRELLGARDTGEAGADDDDRGLGGCV